MRFSFSKVECFKKCPYQFKLRYIDELKTLPDYDDPANALIVGKAIHTGIEKGVDEAIKEYYGSFPVISDLHINEAMKLKALIPKVQKLLNNGGEFEVEINDNGKFIGFIDYLDRKNSIMLDFKYTTEKNFREKYLKSSQIHVYKWYLKELTGYEVKKIGYVHIPKISIRQKKSETIQTFRNRLKEELDKAEPKIKFIDYDENLVDEFDNSIFDCETTVIEYEKIKNQMSDKLTIDFTKNKTRLCDFCEYQEFCEKGESYMISLPKNERRTVNSVETKKVWIYGSPFSGKTTLADKFPDPIMINTDGNINFVTAPVQEIKDLVETEGRITKTTLAWEVFKATVEELEKGSTFKTIVIDLVEDLYESCRLYMYQKMGITHESDDSFRAWDKVRIEFLSTMRKLTNLDYNVVMISHEDTSKDITKRSGDKITSVRPNISEKIANKLAGMVDIVIRCVVIDGNYRLSFKADEVVFGGGRIDPKKKEIPNDYNILMKEVYGETEKEVESVNIEIVDEPNTELVKEEIIPEGFHKVNVEEIQEEKPVRRTRRTRTEK